MVCESGEELHARLALRALWGARADAGRGASGPRADLDESEEVPHISGFQRSMRDDMLSVLRAGHEKRLRKHKLTAGIVPTKLHVADTACVRRLSASVEKVLGQPMVTPSKAWGPSSNQRKFGTEVSLKDDPVVKECITMKTTISSLKGQVGSRTRQISSLTRQLDAMETTIDDHKQEAAASNEVWNRIQKGPDALKEVLGEKHSGAKTSVESLKKQVEAMKEQAKYYQGIARSQRAFFIQSERISQNGGRSSIKWHAAGEVFLVAEPLAVEEDSDLQVRDISNSHANMYETDSWPIEPNVLARRSSPDCPMAPHTEETEKQVQDEKSNSPRLNLSWGLGEDEEDSDYDQRMPATSRSA